MEPVTHILTGACLARAGLNRRAAYATLTMAVAAEFPDIDTLWSLRGPVEGFTHHRGITHTFLGLPFEAALLVAAVYGLHRWRVVRAARAQAAKPPDPTRIRKPLTAAPVRWGALYVFTLVALLSHLLLDYTNNYGLRPFYPFNPRWYAASIVFIFDPWIFALLVAALVLPLIFKLVSSEIGARRQPFRGRGWAIAALLAIVGWWTFRDVQHGKAVDLAMQQSSLQLIPIPVKLQSLCSPNVDCDKPPSDAPHYLTAQRVLANPDPISPFHWSVATDFGAVLQLAEIDTRNVSIVPGENTFALLPLSATLRIAEATPLGRAYLDWSPMPIISVSEPPDGRTAADSGDPGAAGLTVVTFRDPRFMGGWMRDTGRSALMGSVSLDVAGRVVRQTLDGRTEPMR